MAGAIGQGFLLQILAIAVGGGTVQLIIFLLRRRSELKSLDRNSEASLLTGASDFMASMQAARAEDLKRIKELEDSSKRDRAAFNAAFTQLKTEKQHERTSLISQLSRANDENARLQSVVSQLQTDLNIAKGQITRMQHMLDNP